ncbi:hypothetical protein INT48_002935 [Thamnidium elegans]|uniref:Dihydrolipoamide acetyltransferase component of pyruvate dehydrogenase complex n=1 Tax=Thamnidium elegans TaxID=101142 RepID=A0A8H7VVY1_9FUNG|nr:hypothetical protein INT48_002935 [Thamnidium elegans]
MHRVAAKLTQVTKTSTLGFHTSASSYAITRLNLPAMSPTMTEGTIHQWKLKEGDSFAAGDILLELETDKAQIDVEAPEDGILAKIVVNGGKGAVNSLIALLAEEGDDISSVEIPAEEETAAAPASEKKEEKPVAVTPQPAITPISHHDMDTSQLKKPLSPAVMSMVLKYGIKDLGSIKASGNGGRILKGDVLAHLGLIKPKPAPKPTLSIAPPRDQIVFAQVKKVEKKQVIPTFISKDIKIDHLERNLNVNEFIAKAAKYAAQDVTDKKASVIGDGERFRVFNLAEPTYDFITDSYQTSKPYVLSVQDKKTRVNSEVDLIGYLAGERKATSKLSRTVEIRLDGGEKINNNEKAKTFLHRIDHYIRNPNELLA